MDDYLNIRDFIMSVVNNEKLLFIPKEREGKEEFRISEIDRSKYNVYELMHLHEQNYYKKLSSFEVEE